MSIATLENEIVRELRRMTGNRKLTKKDIMEWSTGTVKAQEGETLYRIESLSVNVAVKDKKKEA